MQRNMSGSKKSLTRVESTSSSKTKTPIPDDKSMKHLTAPYVKIVKRTGQLVDRAADDSRYHLVRERSSTLLDGLATFLSDTVDFQLLFHHTAEVLKLVTKAIEFNLYLVDFSRDEIYVSYRPIEDSDESKSFRWKIEEGSTIAAYVAFRKEMIALEKIISNDKRFPLGLGFKSGTIASILAVPVVTPEGDCFSVIELYRGRVNPSFEKDHVKITVAMAGWMGAAVHQNQLRIALGIQQKLSDHLLYLTKCYFGGSGTIEKLVTAMMKFAKECLEADNGSLYILDKYSEDLEAVLFEEGLDGGDFHKKNVKVKIGKECPIVSYVVRTGNSVNMMDPYGDPRFSKFASPRDRLTTKSILCMAVKSFDDTLGVIQVFNKKNHERFNKIDEENFTTFAANCALSFHYYNLKNKADKERRLNKCHLISLTRQMEPCVHDLIEFSANPDIAVEPDFQTFRWYIAPDSTEELANYAYYMITDIIGNENLLIDKLCQFILTARKNYQFIAYHNFEHGFNVCHCMFNILKRNMNRFSILESKSLIIAALCHDVDHPGYTNNYLSVTRDNLALLYEESILENHHYRTTMVMLNHCNVYANVSEAYFKQISKEIKEAIIATDLALYFRFRGRLAQICKDNVLEFGNTAHRSLVKAIMMTSCDLSGQCKPFKVARRITENVYKEFYQQGDEEKSRGTTPLSMMDREKHHMIPEDQVQFLSVVVLPCVDILQKIFPSTSEMYETALELQKDWQIVIELRNSLGKPWQQVVEEDLEDSDSSEVIGILNDL